MTPAIANEMERQFFAHLRKTRTKRSAGRIAVFHCFLKMDKPVSVVELLYAVKRVEASVSFGTTGRTLKAMVACGLATEIPGEGHRDATRFTHVDTVATACGHQHLVCKDCGAVVELKASGVPDSVILAMVKAG